MDLAGGCLVIDELGYMELDRRGTELLFQILTEREEKNAIAIVSNQSFSAWINTFTDPRLCAAIVDRLTYNATIIEKPAPSPTASSHSSPTGRVTPCDSQSPTAGPS